MRRRDHHVGALLSLATERPLPLLDESKLVQSREAFSQPGWKRNTYTAWHGYSFVVGERGIRSDANSG